MNTLQFAAGISLMLFGIYQLRKGADRLFGARLRLLIQRATKSNSRSLFTGFFLSILTPSSTAISLLAMEAVESGYVNIHQVLIFMLGANLGFTLTVQLLAFHFDAFFSFFIAAGIPLFLFGQRPSVRGPGQILMGVGFLLLSIQILSNAVTPLKDSAEVRQLMAILEKHPVLLVGFAMILKIILQSATATIGVAIALTSQEVLPLQSAVAVVLGANLGIAVTALIAGFSREETRRVAVGNLVFKAAGVIACLPLLPMWVELLNRMSPAGVTQVIANAHTLFNLALALVFTPLAPLIARLVERLMPHRSTVEDRFGPRYLDRSSLESPTLALGQATREILHMADQVSAMLRNACRAFQDKSLARCEEVRQLDDRVDLLNNEIKSFLVSLSEQGLSHEESRREMALLSFANELENIGDTVLDLTELAEKKIRQNVEFSKVGWQELEEFYRKVSENWEIAMTAFINQDPVLAKRLVRHKQFINKWELELRNRHFQRLHEGLVEARETSAIHLEVLTNLKRMNSHLTAVAYPILDKSAAG